MKTIRNAQRRGRAHSKAHGFSMIELLVSSAILLIVLAAVVGTLGIAQRTTSQNIQLVDARQNVRAAAKLMSDEIITMGQDYMGQITDDWVFVRAGFLTSMGMPILDIQDPNPGPAVFEQLYAVQTANNTNSATLVRGLDPNFNLVTNLRVYNGSGPEGQPTLNHAGTDQMTLLQVDRIDLQFVDDYGLIQPDTDSLPETAEARYTARAVFTGSNLRLDPITTSPIPSNLNSGDTANLLPANAAQDRLLANRLQKFIDCVVVQDVNPGGAQFLGLVTDVNTTSGVINLDFGDPIGVNPDWSRAIVGAAGAQKKLVANNGAVTVRRAKLIQYFIGSPIAAAASNPLNNSALYRREGARIDPMAFGIENMQVRYILVDETDTSGDGRGDFYTVDVLGNGAWPGAPTPPAADPGRTRQWDHQGLRAAVIRLYGRNDRKDPNLFRLDNTLGAIDRGYFHVDQEFTISLRNAAYNR